MVCHGFTGSPASMRPLAQVIADAGHSVSLPRLPGHGTSWQEMTRTEWTDWYAAVERAYHDLAESCDRVAVVGLSMGGALALRLAEREHVAGVVLINPAIASADPRYAAIKFLKHLRPALKSIGGDIAQPGQDEVSYDHTPLAPAHSMQKLWADVRAHLTQVSAPVLLFTSRTDHVVDASSAALLKQALPQLTQVMLERSYHVATLDYDAAQIEQQTVAFLGQLPT